MPTQEQQLTSLESVSDIYWSQGTGTLFIFLIEVWFILLINWSLININIDHVDKVDNVLVSGVYQNDTVIYIYISVSYSFPLEFTTRYRIKFREL